MSLDWDRLTDQDFEELCYEFLSINGFENLEWYGRSGNDRGRDITCTKSDILLGSIRRTERFIVQCKKWVSRPPEPTDLNNTIAWADFHKPDTLIIMVSNTLTSNTRDWLKEIGKGKSYGIITYEEINFKLFFDKNKNVFEKYFGARRLETNADSDLHQRLLLVLAKTPSLTKSEISEAASISITKTESILQKLTSDKLVSLEDKRYSLERKQTVFLKVAEKLLTSKNKFDFLLSDYAVFFINPELVTYIESRYFLSLSQPHKDNLLKTMKISPSALCYALFGSNASYKNGFDQLNKLKIDSSQKARWTESFSHQFVFEMLRELLSDLTNPDCSKALAKENVEGYYMNLEIKMANIKQLLLNMKSESGIMLLRAIGKINAGDLLSATDPDVYLRTADVLSNLNLDKKAIENYDLAISQIKDPTKLKAAYNNKGVLMMNSNNWGEAIKLFDEALKIDSDFKEAINNRKICLAKLELK